MQKGFTLIELVIIVAIIGVISAIIIINANEYISKSTTGLPQGEQSILQGK